MNWQFEDNRIYSHNEKNELMAQVTFVHAGENTVNIDHTYVNPLLRGQGTAGEMLKIATDYIRKKGLKVTASCSYANAWLKKNFDSYSDIISQDMDNQDIACRIDKIK